jgi:hypothetical protein
MKKCAAAKGIDFCGDCPDYPCDELKEFQEKMPHRIELWDAQKRIKEKGCKVWYSEMVQHYSCQNCGTLNSAYDLSCRKCSQTPSCEYVRLHQEEVGKKAGKMGP